MWSWLTLAVAMWLWLALAVSIVVVRPLRKAQDSLPRLYWTPADDGVTGRLDDAGPGNAETLAQALDHRQQQRLC